MLKRFSFENYLSFKDESTLDLTATGIREHSEHVHKFKDVGILKSVVIYGANASGKSNIVKALSFSRKLILNGIKDVSTYKKYFRLDEQSKNNHTKFDFELEFDNKFYAYGFSISMNEGIIQSEWLYQIGIAKPKKIFGRNGRDIDVDIKDSKLNPRFEIYKEDMKEEFLFLKEIAGKNLKDDEVKIFSEIFGWFEKKLLLIYPDNKFSVTSLHDNKEQQAHFLEYLKLFDTGIEEIKSIDEDFDKINIDKPLKEFIEKYLRDKNKSISIPYKGELLTFVKDDDSNIKVKRLGLVHNTNIDDFFDLADESDGTQRLFDLIPLISMFSSDMTIVIDEFERSLHPNLTEKFLEIFYKKAEDNKSQLIVTSHESKLLSLDLLRRDEIWFVKKNKQGVSETYPLSKFNIRNDKKIEKDYLVGRFDAVPIINIYDDI